MKGVNDATAEITETTDAIEDTVLSF